MDTRDSPVPLGGEAAISGLAPAAGGRIRRTKRKRHALLDLFAPSLSLFLSFSSLRGRDGAVTMTPRGAGDAERVRRCWTVLIGRSHLMRWTGPSCNWSPLNCRSLGNCLFFAPALRLRPESDGEREGERRARGEGEEDEKGWNKNYPSSSPRALAPISNGTPWCTKCSRSTYEASMRNNQVKKENCGKRMETRSIGKYTIP